MTLRLCTEEEVKAWLRGSKEGRQPGWTPPFFSRGVEILKQGKLKDCVLNDTRDGATATCSGARVKRLARYREKFAEGPPRRLRC